MVQHQKRYGITYRGGSGHLKRKMETERYGTVSRKPAGKIEKHRTGVFSYRDEFADNSD